MHTIYVLEPLSIHLHPSLATRNPEMNVCFSTAHRERAYSERILRMFRYVAYPSALYAVLSEALSVSRCVVRKQSKESCFFF
jgi:hypothetical protein